MQFIYWFALLIYSGGIRIAAFFLPKAKLWVDGRKNLFKNLETQIAHDKPILWVHAASLGEFEQGRALLEALKVKYPTHRILLTFFSPSGYEARKNYAHADYVFYLPLDGPRNARRFLEIVQPSQVFFIKYEFWYFLLRAIQTRNIPLYLVSAHFRPNQIFFKSYGGFFRKALKCFTHIFVQTDASAPLLAQIGLHNYSIAGDTRLDRVLAIKKEAQVVPLVEAFSKNTPTGIAGSTWPSDEALLAEVWKQTLKPKGHKLIIAPHEIDEAHIQQVLQQFKGEQIIRYSAATENEQQLKQAQILVIDNIGLLNRLYAYGTWAYIGGGFGKGIHNTLEPAVFEIPVLFGPKYQKFVEAQRLVEMGGFFEIQHAQDAIQIWEKLQHPEVYANAQQAIRDYITRYQGATTHILHYLTTQKKRG